MKKGSYKIATRFVSDDDVTIHTHDITVWEKSGVCVARLANGTESRAQVSHHGCGRKSVQMFDSIGRLITEWVLGY